MSDSSMPQAMCGARKLTGHGGHYFTCTEPPHRYGNHEATGTDGGIVMAWPRDDAMDAILMGEGYRLPAFELTGGAR